MLRLALPTEPAWLDLGWGVRVLARPLTTALAMAAEVRIVEERQRLREAAEVQGIPDPFGERLELRTGLGYELRMAAIAEATILAWEGVGDAEGTAAAPVTRETCAELMRIPQIAMAFDKAIAAPGEALLAEGNGSGASPSTISPPGGNTAPPAPSPTAENATSAPTPSAPPERPTVPPHGSPDDPASPLPASASAA